MTRTSGQVAPSPRRLGALLLLGIYTMPILFVWFVFRPGYSVALRQSAVAWLVFNFLPLVALISPAG